MASPADPRISSAHTAPLIPVHRALGGGTVADTLLWRRRSPAAAATAVVTATWFFFELAGYRFLPLLADALLLSVAILFFWAKSAAFLHRPLPPLPNLEISDQVVERASDEASLWINAGLGMVYEIAAGKDMKLFFKAVSLLWAISYIGSFFNFLTLIYLVFLVSISMPALYQKYHSHIDEKLVSVHSLATKHCGGILEKCTSFSNEMDGRPKNE